MKQLIRFILAACISTFAFFPVHGQNGVIQSISEKDLKAHLNFLASDLLQGRELSTPVPGLQIAAEYIRAEASRIGLQPAGNDFRQPFNLISVSRDPVNSYFQVTDARGKTLVKSDSVFAFSAPDDLILEGKVVFAGYGWRDSVNGYNDLEDMDVKDKLVMIMSRNPETAVQGVNPAVGGDRGSFQAEWVKIRRINQSGAKGVIFVSDPMDTSGGMLPLILGYVMRASYSLEGQQDTRGSRRPSNMFFIPPSLADSILAMSGKSLAGLQNQINRSGKPASFELSGVTGKINLAKVRKPVPAGNIVGIVEGSDPVLKNECIVYVAHYDHMGMDRQGNVYNGADDNASGVAGLLEIAEAFEKLDKKPKRSVVFAWVTGEELGLLGSLYYSLHPVIPLEKTLACIDLDMIGRVKADDDTASYVMGEKNVTGRNGIYVITGGRSAELDSLNSKICAKMGLKPDGSMSQDYINRSDYAHFHRKGIPILGFSTGIHTDYHKVTDEITKIDFPKMRVVTELAFRVGYAVADKKERIVVDKPLANR